MMKTSSRNTGRSTERQCDSTCGCVMEWKHHVWYLVRWRPQKHSYLKQVQQSIALEWLKSKHEYFCHLAYFLIDVNFTPSINDRPPKTKPRHPPPQGDPTSEHQQGAVVLWLWHWHALTYHDCVYLLYLLKRDYKLLNCQLHVCFPK